MLNISEKVAAIETTVQSLGANGRVGKSERKSIRMVLQEFADLSGDASISLAETVIEACDSCPSASRRSLGSLLIRILSSTETFSESDLRTCRKNIVKFVESNCLDFTTGLLDQRANNHEKLDALKMVHRNACDRLDPLRQSFVSLNDLAGRRERIMRSLSHKPSKAYLQAFGYGVVEPMVASILSQIEDLVQASGHELHVAMQQFVDDIEKHLAGLDGQHSFLFETYAKPFFVQVHHAARSRKASLVGEFACEISGPKKLLDLPKKYPLHLVGSRFEVSIPLVNSGPGSAQNVRTVCMSDDCAVGNEETQMGNVNPGQFVLQLVVQVIAPCEALGIEVEVMWNVVGDPEEHRFPFTVRIRGQPTDIDWNKLAEVQPYTLEIAVEGDFYGRRDAVKRIVRRVTGSTMQSCYITGQKRVGKSSLARAVETGVDKLAGDNVYHVLYLECGEFKQASGDKTLRELGSRIEKHFAHQLRRGTPWEAQDYLSSLTALNQLLNILRTEDERNRFIVVLDEFDEINESLYLHGDLADTFFLNLRTLASQRNLAFILVGAERMPFVMSSQGERLNRFERELLDSFNAQREWEDYTSLICDPVEGFIEFDDSAVRLLYELTHGNPYFTKALCAEVYELALETKDAEIFEPEIEKAARRLLGKLDSNAFAHYWRDGIRGDDRDIEITAVRRCRVLVSWSRTVRSGKRPDGEGISEHVRGKLRPDEVRPELDDFCRRRVFKEERGEYQPTVKLFARWLEEVGFAQLVEGYLGDELEEARRIEEDRAYVTSNEIVEVVETWSLYQGQRLAEERVRAWLDQAGTNLEKRLLFNLLENLRFFTDLQAQEAMIRGFDVIKRELPVLVQTERGERRRDVLVTFVGGATHSGSHCAPEFARVNKLMRENVFPVDKLSKRLSLTSKESVSAVVLVDDFIGTGDTLVDALKKIDNDLKEKGIESKTRFFVFVLCCTTEGERRVRNSLKSRSFNVGLEVGEILDSKHRAFGPELGIWETAEERDKAKALITSLGAHIDRVRPLGYKDQGLLVTFSRNCPNNSLPILHSSGRAGHNWTPLFERSKL